MWKIFNTSGQIVNWLWRHAPTHHTGGVDPIDHGSIDGLGDDDHTQYTLKSLFDAANTILKADVQATPEGLTVAEQRLVGRITGGDIDDLTGAQALTILSGQAGATFSWNAQNLNNVGHIGLGNNAASALYGIYYNEYPVEIDDNLARASVFAYIDAYKTSAAYANILYGAGFETYVGLDNTQNWTTPVGLRGVSSVVGTEGGNPSVSTITGIASFYAAGYIGAATNDPIVTNLYGLYILARALIGNDKLTNDYGIYIGDQAGGATLNYAIYTNAGLVHFGDDVDIVAGKVLKTDTLNEITGDAGVTVDTVLVKDGELKLVPKASSTGAEGTIFYDSDDDHVYVATEA